MLVLANTETKESQTFNSLQELYDWVSKEVPEQNKDRTYISFITQLKAHVDAFLEMTQKPIEKQKPVLIERPLLDNLDKHFFQPPTIIPSTAKETPLTKVAMNDKVSDLQNQMGAIDLLCLKDQTSFLQNQFPSIQNLDRISKVNNIPVISAFEERKEEMNKELMKPILEKNRQKEYQENAIAAMKKEIQQKPTKYTNKTENELTLELCKHLLNKNKQESSLTLSEKEQNELSEYYKFPTTTEIANKQLYYTLNSNKKPELEGIDRNNLAPLYSEEPKKQEKSEVENKDTNKKFQERIDEIENSKLLPELEKQEKYNTQVKLYGDTKNLVEKWKSNDKLSEEEKKEYTKKFLAEINKDKQEPSEISTVEDEIFGRNSKIISVISESESNSIQSELPLLTEITKNNPDAIFYPFQQNNKELRSTPITKWDNRHIFNVDSRVVVPNPSIQNMSGLCAEKFFDIKEEEKDDDEESVITVTTVKENKSPLLTNYNDFYDRKKWDSHVVTEYTKETYEQERIREEKCKKAIYELKNSFFSNFKSPEINKFHSKWNQDVNIYNDCVKLFLINPDFAEPGTMKKIPKYLQFIFDYDVEYRLHLATYFSYEKDGNGYTSSPNYITIDLKRYFSVYNSLLQNSYFKTKIYQEKSYIVESIISTYLDNKLHPNLLRNFVFSFTKENLESKKGSVISSSELYSKWLEFLKNIFGSEETIWKVVEASTNTRQFSRDMKSHGFTTRRRSVGILFEDVDYKEALKPKPPKPYIPLNVEAYDSGDNFSGV